MGELVQRLPNYCPKINEILGEARDLDLTEMRREYPHGFICCGNEYLLGKFSQFRGQHMKSKKHQKNILDSATQEYKENLGDCDTLLHVWILIFYGAVTNGGQNFFSGPLLRLKDNLSI